MFTCPVEIFHHPFQNSLSCSLSSRLFFPPQSPVDKEWKDSYKDTFYFSVHANMENMIWWILLWLYLASIFSIPVAFNWAPENTKFFHSCLCLFLCIFLCLWQSHVREMMCTSTLRCLWAQEPWQWSHRPVAAFPFLRSLWSILS